MKEETNFILRELVGRVKQVRRWLVGLAVLKVTALCLLFVCVYVGGYAWVDHRLHLGGGGRIIAFCVLVGGVLGLLFVLLKYLITHISCVGAANHIERQMNFDQQLVTAIEYYENKGEYPYSVALAEHLIEGVDRDCVEVDFGWTVAKWQGWVFSGIIVAGIICGSVFLYSNYVYFGRYFTRLTRPLSVVEPLPPTKLEAITKDMVVGLESRIRLEARILGRVPETGDLIIQSVDADGPASRLSQDASRFSQEVDEIVLQLQPREDGGDSAKFRKDTSLAEGRYRYRFLADEASTPWHNIRVCTIPSIKLITAIITPPGSREIKPVEEKVEDYSLELIPASRVELIIEATTALSEVEVTGLGGGVLKNVRGPGGTEKFTVKFTAYDEGYIKFRLIGVGDVVNDKLPSLQILHKQDEPAKFKQVAPGGDYLATNVGSVPITFEVSDDFGLSWVSLYREIAGEELEPIKVAVEPGSKTVTFTEMLELEDYNLEVGDSILYYARANDVATGLKRTHSTSTSEIYFIEIRPYRQIWVQGKTPLPGQGKQGLKGEVREKLITILEYTRAFLKKTWVIANQGELTDKDRGQLESISSDVDYADEQLTYVRNNPGYHFDSDDEAILDEILEYYGQASGYLSGHDAMAAVVPEKHAYRILRKFIIELVKGTPVGIAPPKRRDRVIMEEKVHLKRYEKERIEWELKQLADKMAQLIAEQEKLKKQFDNFLAQQEEKQKNRQQATDEESWIDPTDRGAVIKPTASRKEGAGGQQSPAPTIEGALKPLPKGQVTSQGEGEGRGKGKGKGEGKGKGNGKGKGQIGSDSKRASVAEQMAMLRARQRDLEEKVKQINEALGQLPVIRGNKKQDPRTAQNDREFTRQYLEQSMKSMEAFGEKMAEAQYQTGEELEKTLARAGEVLEEAQWQMDLAQERLINRLGLSDKQIRAQEAEKIARELAQMADEYDESLSDREKAEMVSALNAATRLLGQMSEQDWGLDNVETVSQLDENKETSQADEMASSSGEGEAGQGGEGETGGGSGGGAKSKIKMTHIAPKAQAELLARKFWSISIKAKKLRGGLAQKESSDAEFYKLENDFFESAARFRRSKVGK